jgi:hypothetical protein
MPSNQLSSFELVGIKKFIQLRQLHMSRKKKIKEKEGSKDSDFQNKKTEERPDDEKTKVMDFGGMPERDLKKNLGCG